MCNNLRVLLIIKVHPYQNNSGSQIAREEPGGSWVGGARGGKVEGGKGNRDGAGMEPEGSQGGKGPRYKLTQCIVQKWEEWGLY